MNNRYFISEHLHKEHVAHGSIGNVDIEANLLQQGYRPIQFPYIFSFSIKAKLARFFYLLKVFFTVPAGAILVFQFPLHARIHLLLIKWLRWKKVHIICLIADIEGQRNLDAILLQQEIKRLRQFKWFIVHNESMAKWIQSVAPHAHLSQLEFFDFLANPVHKNRPKTNHIIFAGNLDKSPFVNNLGSLPVPFHIYGPGYRAPAAPNVTYEGEFTSDTIISKLNGSFGLVWDGDRIETCVGKYGEYLAYNSPHKLSLYILAGLPIIAPTMSASAHLIKKYGIGVTIDSLHELENVINSISEAGYRQMIANMQPLATKISTGQCLAHALAVLSGAILKKRPERAPGSNLK